MRRTEAIRGILSRGRLIRGTRYLEKHWRGWDGKGQEDSESEGVVGKESPMIPGASRTETEDPREDAWS